MVGDQIQTLFQVPVGKALKGLSVDSLGNAWLASQGDSKVYAVSPDGTILGGFQGGGVDGPWGVTVDGEDHVWVANFGPLDGKPYSARISKLAGANPETRPPGRLLGDPISPGRERLGRSLALPSFLRPYRLPLTRPVPWSLSE